MLALLLTAAMLVAGVGIMPAQEVEAAEGPELTVKTSASEVRPGDTVHVELWLEPGVNVISFVCNVNLNKDIYTIDTNSLVPGEVYMKALLANGNPQILFNDDQSYSIYCDFMGPYDNGGKVVEFDAIVNDDAFGNGAIQLEPIGAEVGTSDEDRNDVSAEEMKYSTEGPDGNIIENGTLPVIIELESISLGETEKTMTRGASDTLEVTATPTNALIGKTVEWTTSNDQVVTVDQEGNIEAVSIGEATVTATVEDKTASVHITVNAPALEAINISGESTSVMKGKKLQLTAEFVPADADADPDQIVWSSSDESVATVDQNGLVTAVENGDTVITATYGEITGSCTVTVETIPLKGIRINTESTTIHLGETEKLEVIYNPENTTDDRTVTWSSSDDKVASVAADGTVTAVGAGSAVIKAAVGENFTAECKVTVDAPLKAIVPDETEMNIIKGQTDVITYKLDPVETTDDKTVTFTSSDESVATVDEKGTVKGIKAGTAIITLTGVNGITATVTVTVKEIPIDAVVLDKASAVVEKGETVELTATVQPENTTDDDKTITWSSSDETVATVSSETTQPGEKVTVTTTDKGGKATITAKAWNGTEAVCEIIVPVHVETVTLPGSVSLEKGETDMLELSYSPKDHDDKITSVEWTSSDETVASVDAEGMVKALKEGTAQITAVVSVIRMGSETPVQLDAVQTTVKVTENHLNAELGAMLAFEKMEDPLLKNQSIDMDTLLNLEDILDANDITDEISIAWTSSDEEVAAIDQTGRLTGLAAGKTTIKAVITATNGAGEVIGTYSVETEVEVKEIALESIAFDKIIKEMVEGQTEELHIIYNPENTTDTRDAVWSSSDESVLTVADGRITAVKAGKATVTAKVGDKEVSCEILVKEKPAQGGQGSGSGTAGAAGLQTGEKDGTVRTGDQANIIVYIALLAGAMAAIVVIWRRKRSMR